MDRSERYTWGRLKGLGWIVNMREWQSLPRVQLKQVRLRGSEWPDLHWNPGQQAYPLQPLPLSQPNLQPPTQPQQGMSIPLLLGYKYSNKLLLVFIFTYNFYTDNITPQLFPIPVLWNNLKIKQVSTTKKIGIVGNQCLIWRGTEWNEKSGGAGRNQCHSTHLTHIQENLPDWLSLCFTFSPPSLRMFSPKASTLPAYA
jgi:hypothetical protein